MHARFGRFAVTTLIIGAVATTMVTTLTQPTDSPRDRAALVSTEDAGVLQDPVTQDPPPRGAARVGGTWYPVPSGAVFVDPVKGNDGASGAKEAPKKTVKAAISAAPSGGTVVMRAGVYHEGGLWIGKPLTLQNQPGETAWFDGSVPVTGWTAEGTTWSAPWNVQWDNRTSFSSGGNDPSWVNPAYPMAGWPDLAFRNGDQLRQVASNPGAGQFAVDYAARKLIVGDDPNGADIRASDLNKAITVSSPDVTLQGFGVRRYANSASTLGVIYLARHRNLIRNVAIEDVATTGLSFYSDGTNGAGTASNVTVQRAGLCGICGTWMDKGVIKNSLINDANYERFNNVPTAASIKITRTRGVIINNNAVTNGNGSQGIWLDEAVVGYEIVGNTVTNAGYAGIEAELSSSGLIANNQVMGHKYGIYLFDAEGVQVLNNTIGDSTTSDLHMSQDFRRQNNPSHIGRDPRYPPGDPTNTWLLRDITIRNNTFAPDSSGSLYQVYVLDKNTNRPADSMNITLTGNAFTAMSSTQRAYVIGWGQGDNRTVKNFSDWESFNTFRTGTQALTNITPTSAASLPAGTGQMLSVNTYTDAVTAARAASAVAWPLPFPLAPQLWVPVGTAQIGAFLR